MFDAAHDARVRSAVFDWLAAAVERHGDVLPRQILAAGMVLDGVRVPLVGPQGIFKPQVLREAPLSITTAPQGPYDDGFLPGGFLQYRYRGTDPNHPDNRGLRTAQARGLPLIYFFGIARSKYLAAWPVFVVGDDPQHLAFTIQVDDGARLGETVAEAFRDLDHSDTARRAYLTALTKVRVHQRAFRERVLEAYRRQCAFCRLRHEELLDAAHVVPDCEPAGDPRVANGLALCKLHHTAFDRHFVGLRPDYVIEVRRDILREHDGPTLVHAIQALHGRPIQLPRRAALQPDRALVEMRYARFLQCG